MKTSTRKLIRSLMTDYSSVARKIRRNVQEILLVAECDSSTPLHVDDHQECLRQLDEIILAATVAKEQINQKVDQHFADES